jgi:K+-transporting ATPase ATPase C chain
MMPSHAVTKLAPATSDVSSKPHERPVRDNLMPAVRATLVTLVLTGLAYPLLVTGLAQLLFPARATGSLVQDESGRVVGSELIAQPFTSAAYFQPRPSAAGEKGWDPTASGGSNLGPTSKKLRDSAAALVERLTRENPDAGGPVPVELVTSSGSGLDPDLSPQAARWQAVRVARARRVAPERIRALVEELTEGRFLGFIGEPRVNVLRIDLALDRRFGPPTGAAP